MIATDESGNTSKKQITVTVTETNATENPETVTETSENLPNNNNTTPPNKNQVNSSNKAELVNYYNKVVNEWNSKYENGTISWDELMENCPGGYKCWSCSYCGKWTGDFKSL